MSTKVTIALGAVLTFVDNTDIKTSRGRPEDDRPTARRPKAVLQKSTIDALTEQVCVWIAPVSSWR